MRIWALNVLFRLRCVEAATQSSNEVSPSNVINYSTYLTRQKASSMDYIRMQHLCPGWPTGKWIVIISQLEQQRHTEAHRFISDQLAVRLSSPALLGVIIAPFSRLQSNYFAIIKEL